MRATLVFTLLLIAFSCFASSLKLKKIVARLSKRKGFTTLPIANHLQQILGKTKFLGRGRFRKPVLRQKVDLLFLVEGSTQYGQKQYINTINLIRKLVDRFYISPGVTRIGFIEFNSLSRTLMKFDGYYNRDAVQKRLHQISRRRVTSRHGSLTSGVEAAVKEFSGFTRPNTKRILITFTAERNDRYTRRTKFNRALNKLKRMRVERTVIAFKTKRRCSWWRRCYYVKSYLARRLATHTRKYFASLTASQLSWLTRIIPRGKYAICNRRRRTLYDQCNNKCTCTRGYRRNCYRVRKEWNSMSTFEKRRYINTYITLTSKQPYKNRYNTFIKIHSRYFPSGIHRASGFLPWHRWYITAFENLLKEVDCRVTLPYWDWSRVSNDPWNSNMMFSPHAHGFGTVNLQQSACVTTGPFRASKWRLPNGRCLTRQANGNPPSAVDVRAVHNLRNFNVWETALRVNLHNTVHCLIGGTMCDANSATAPEFFLHHAFVDKMWNDAQKKSPAFHYGTWKNSISRMVASPYSAKQYLNLKNMPGYIRVAYKPPKVVRRRRGRPGISLPGISGWGVSRSFKGIKTRIILSLPRRPTTLVSKKANALFHVSKKEKKIAMSVKKALSKHPIIRHGFNHFSGLPKGLRKTLEKLRKKKQG